MVQANPLYIKSNDETIKKIILPSNTYKNCSYNQYLNYLTFEKLYNKVREIEDHNIKYNFIIICDFLKDKIICGTAVHKLCSLQFINYYKYIIINNIYVSNFRNIFISFIVEFYFIFFQCRSSLSLSPFLSLGLTAVTRAVGIATCVSRQDHEKANCMHILTRGTTCAVKWSLAAFQRTLNICARASSTKRQHAKKLDMETQRIPRPYEHSLSRKSL
jgi:hypothetical protein